MGLEQSASFINEKKSNEIIKEYYCLIDYLAGKLLSYEGVRVRKGKKNIRFSFAKIRNRIDKNELINEGLNSAYKSIDKYDPSKGSSLSGYIANNAVYSMARYLSNSQPNAVPIPIYAQEKVSKIDKMLLTDEDKINLLRNEFNNISIDSCQLLFASNRGNYVSIGAPLGSSDFTMRKKLSDIIPDVSSQLSISDSVNMKQIVLDLFESLSTLEKKIIRYRYGINSDTLTYREIGSKYNLTGERIRQIEKIALEKMRKRTKKIYNGKARNPRELF